MDVHFERLERTVLSAFSSYRLKIQALEHDEMRPDVRDFKTRTNNLEANLLIKRQRAFPGIAPKQPALVLRQYAERTRDERASRSLALKLGQRRHPAQLELRLLAKIRIRHEIK